MDRFIEELEKCDAGTILSLKSNMDRFIESCSLMLNQLFYTLKSNMDRFIVFKSSFITEPRKL